MEEKIELLERYGINIEENKFLLGKDYIELVCKINYLVQNNIPLVMDDKLNEIFWISYKKLEKKYGLTKEELFKYIEKPKVKKLTK